jgi:hypothetical protein
LVLEYAPMSPFESTEIMDQLMTFLRQYAPADNYLSISKTNNTKYNANQTTYSFRRLHSCDANGKGGTYVAGTTADIVINLNGQTYYASLLFAHEENLVYRRMVRLAQKQNDPARETYKRLGFVQCDEDAVVQQSTCPIEFNVYATCDTAGAWIQRSIETDQEAMVGPESA